MPTCFFPGQGSQVKGMGGDLFLEFADLTNLADEVLGYSIKELCLEDPQQLLGQTQYTQPALYVVSVLSYLKWLQTHERPLYVLGHSLGEYNALFAAGAFDFVTGLRLVQKRGQLMQRIEGGGMAAVVGLTADQISDILSTRHSTLFIANYNSITQTVISGAKEDIFAAKNTFEHAGARYIPLSVSGAFHTPYLGTAQEEFLQFLAEFMYAEPNITVVANVTGAPYQPQSVIDNLSMHIVKPVLWTKSIQYLLDLGETDFHEIGSGRVLTGLLAKIRQGN